MRKATSYFVTEITLPSRVSGGSGGGSAIRVASVVREWGVGAAIARGIFEAGSCLRVEYPRAGRI